MAWTLTQDVAEFVAAAGGLLRARPAEHTLPLSITQTLQARGAHAFGAASPMFGWWEEKPGTVTAALLRTPPFPAVITAMTEEATASLAAALAGAGLQPGGVNAPAGDARRFAAAWQERTGQVASVERRSRLYRLAGLRPPAGMPGRPRTPLAADRGLLVAWLDAFRTEIGETAWRSGDVVDDRLSYGGLTLWEDGGQPVSLAGVTRRSAGQVRVGPVYTPPERRGRGYGGAVTAAVSRAALDAGADEVLLFTDLANPTSNALYQRIGYEPVSDFLVLAFRVPGDRALE
jgi:predicted GNAT family acetyltransferase